MVKLTRRTFAFGVISLAAASTLRTTRAAESDGRVAIIDTPEDTRRFLSQIPKHVRVIGRYFSRGCQPSVSATKRIAFNDENFKCGTEKALKGPSEATELLDHEFAILSVYQYNSSSPHKFLFGLPDLKRAQGDKRTFAQIEADTDANAAVDQAARVGQPPAAPIYFGLDFNLRRKAEYALYEKYNKKKKKTEFLPVLDPSTGKKVENSRLIDACLEYFARVKAIVGPHLGVYGNGFANDLLRREELVAYSWLSASTGYDETASFLRTKDWHLFQSQVDRAWFVSGEGCSGFDLDMIIQNPSQEKFGAWDKSGVVSLDSAKTQTIFEQRRPTLRETPVHMEPEASSPAITQESCKRRIKVKLSPIDRKRTVRVMSENGEWLGVDVDEDGKLDGYCLKADFAPDIKHMPD